ncbi:MAG TPA: BREX system ATP-binding domain-containing protein [Pyrinomonadaceae bacterium]|nr:BREX system ATP-binding domain-containing protein [Pyrinomonadaceae bacterium]
MNSDEQIQHRRAIEALRSGVPNRDAVMALGCAQPDIEKKFRQQLQSAKQGVVDGSMTHGMLVAGDFGTGKSHLLEYLLHLALEENFVCSKVVISKETPLYDPVKLYRAAAEAAIVPGKRGDALTEIATKLNFNSQAYADLYQWVNRSGADLNSRFAATLFLFERMPNDPELSNRIIRFWSGEQIGVAEIKKYLRACRETVTYKIDRILVKELALQRFKFASRLMVAAGYAGWVLLVDEVELIGRYSLMQRAKSYAELARWMGKLEGANFAGLTAVLAITTDFEEKILQEREDLDKVPGKLRARASETDLLLASQAERGMRIIQRERAPLKAPDSTVLEQTYEKVRSIHAEAYAWEPPPVSSVELLRATGTRMREYVKRWITEWDLKHLDPGYKPKIEVTELKPDYTEDPNLQVPSEEEPEGRPE